MFFNRKLSRSQNDVSWRDAYRSDASRYNKAYGVGPSSSSSSSSSSNANPFAPKSRISLYTQSLGLGGLHRAGGLSSSTPVSPEATPVSQEKVSETIEEVTTSREEVRGSKEEVRGSNEEVRGSKEEVSGSKEEVSGSKEEVTESKEDMRQSEEVTENVTSSSSSTSSEGVPVPTASVEAEVTSCDKHNCIHNYNCQRTPLKDAGDATIDSARQEQRETKEHRETNEQQESGEGGEKAIASSRDNNDVMELNEGNIPTFTRPLRMDNPEHHVNKNSNHQNKNTALNDDNNSETQKTRKEYPPHPERIEREPKEDATGESAASGTKARRFNLRGSSREEPTSAAAATPQQQNQNHSQFTQQSSPLSPHSPAATPTSPLSSSYQPSFTPAPPPPPQQQPQQQQPQPPPTTSNPSLNPHSPPQSPGGPGSPVETEEWTDIEPTARHPPFPNPPTTDTSATGKKDDRPYPTPGSYIPAHFCNILYTTTDRDLKFLQKGEFVGIPLKSPHQVSVKSFENHRKFVYATIIDIINLKDFRSDASNLLRLNLGHSRKTKTSELKDVYQITSVHPDVRAAEAEKLEEAKRVEAAKKEEANKQSSSGSVSSEKEKMRSDTRTQETPEEGEANPYYYTPTGSSCSGTNSTPGTGSTSRTEFEESGKSPEEERMARKDLEENARKKLEEERLKRKAAKEAEWRAKYGFDKDDPLMKKKQERDEKKKTFWERCSGVNPETVVEEPQEEQQFATMDANNIEDIEEVKERISETLDEAWELPEAERKKAVKKLLLQWHPDKNLERGEEAKVLFQHLQKEIKRCEGGIPRIKLTKWRNFMFGKARPAQRGRPGPFKGPTAEEPATAPRSPFTAKKEFTRASSFTPGSRKADATANQPSPETNGRRFAGHSFDSDSVPEEPPAGNFNSHESRDSFFKNYMDKMRETRSRARGTSPAGEGRADSADRGRDSSRDSWRDHLQGRRWFEQAQRDLKSAKHDFDNPVDPAYEWVCLKCHHAAEKALKAVLMSQNLPSVESHDLTVIVAVAQNAQLTRLVNQMTSLLGDPERIIYPHASSSKIPGEAFTQGIATMALSVAKSIISCCDLIVMKTR